MAARVGVLMHVVPHIGVGGGGHVLADAEAGCRDAVVECLGSECAECDKCEGDGGCGLVLEVGGKLRMKYLPLRMRGRRCGL